MTTYQAIEKLIDERMLTIEMAQKIIFEAYGKNRIDGFEYEELYNKAIKKHLNS